MSLEAFVAEEEVFFFCFFLVSYSFNHEPIMNTAIKSMMKEDETHKRLNAFVTAEIKL